MPLKFHWRLVQSGGTPGLAVASERIDRAAALPDLDSQLAFCRLAARWGIESLLVDMNYGKPEPLVLSLALALATDRIRFMVAARPGLMSPTLFVQQVNTFSTLAEGRISLNIVAGHSPEEQRYYGDHLVHDDRYKRLDEWLQICLAFWKREGPVEHSGEYYQIVGGRLNTPFVGQGRTRPEIYLGGSSPQSREAAARHADCWVRFADTPEKIHAQAAPLRAAGIEVGLRLSVLCRLSREAAVRDAHALAESEAARRRGVEEAEFVRRSDARSMHEAHSLGEREWLAPWLWTGLAGLFGAPNVCLIGTPEDVVNGLLEFRDAGVSQFILSGWPSGEELERFGRDVIPLVRAAEGEPKVQTPAGI
jgi:alkanesulfonate monooxygenase